MPLRLTEMSVFFEQLQKSAETSWFDDVIPQIESTLNGHIIRGMIKRMRQLSGGIRSRYICLNTLKLSS